MLLGRRYATELNINYLQALKRLATFTRSLRDLTHQGESKTVQTAEAKKIAGATFHRLLQTALIA
jgi:hypothetical protein